MRPIVTNANNIGYSKNTELARKTVEREDDDNEPLIKRRRIATEDTISTLLYELDTFVKAHWNVNKNRWDTKRSERQASTLIENIGTGYLNATQPLIQQTGQYCAYCDTPVFSDVRAEPILPLEWFPMVAFDYDKLVLACPTCRTLLESGVALNRSSGDVTTLTNSSNYAWPQLFWQGMQNGSLLPFSYQLVYLPTFSFGETFTPIPPNEISQLLKYYRLGYVQVDHSSPLLGHVNINLPDSPPTRIASWVMPTNFGLSVEPGVKNLISLFQLNLNGAAPGAKDGLDCRQALRTMAHLKALDLLDTILKVAQNGDQDLLNRLFELWGKTAQATGFWGVWLSVFRNVPSIQPDLANLFPGTTPITWTLP